MADAYRNIVGGGLSLKGIGKKKKKKSSESSEMAVAAASTAAASSSSTSTSAAVAVTSTDSSVSFTSGHTASEVRRLETMAERQVRALEKGEVKSHREKVKDFNSYLSNLTEHYDLPKVSKGN